MNSSVAYAAAYVRSAPSAWIAKISGAGRAAVILIAMKRSSLPICPAGLSERRAPLAAVTDWPGRQFR